MKILITGGCGFLGSNLAAYGIRNNDEITVFDNLSRYGSDKNRHYLEQVGRFDFIHGDVRNRGDVDSVVRQGGYDVIFHVAGQVAMTTSVAEPYKDFETNVAGSLNVLEAVRKYSPETSVFFSSSNKVYGDLEQYHYEETPTRYKCAEYPDGFDESLKLDFRSPYGCSKGAADQYMLDYHRTFGIKTTVFRHSSMYGSRQFSTFDQGWVGWFIMMALKTSKDPNAEPFTISGNGKQVRDILNAQDMVNLYYQAANNPDKVAGQVFNIGGTMEQSLSLLELFAILEEMFNIKRTYKQLPPRYSDQKVFVADIGKINKAIGWRPVVTAREGISSAVKWISEM